LKKAISEPMERLRFDWDECAVKAIEVVCQ